jgi:hypothetical protein
VITIDDRYEEFLAAASQAMSGPGDEALEALGFWDLLPHLDDPDARDAVFASFRAQGRALASSRGLSGLVAQPFIEASPMAPGSVLAAVPRMSRRRGLVWNILGDIGDRSVLFDAPGTGTFIVPGSEVELHPVEVAGRATVHEVTADLSAHRPFLTDEAARPIRERSTYLGRLALASDILGASERVVAMAVEYAEVREQFGQPIGTFQAVRHLLAWATTDCTAVDTAVRSGILVLPDPPIQFGATIKALAGRNGRRACERSLQVFGGIGFTEEHDHHQFHSRVLLLDALLGSSSELSNSLGAWLRTTGADPAFATALLFPATQHD